MKCVRIWSAPLPFFCCCFGALVAYRNVWKCSAANVHGRPPYLFAIGQTMEKLYTTKWELNWILTKILNAHIPNEPIIEFIMRFYWSFCEIIWLVAFNFVLIVWLGISRNVAAIGNATEMCVPSKNSSPRNIEHLRFYESKAKCLINSCICIVNRNSINKSITNNLFNIRCITFATNLYWGWHFCVYNFEYVRLKFTWICWFVFHNEWLVPFGIDFKTMSKHQIFSLFHAHAIAPIFSRTCHDVHWRKLGFYFSNGRNSFRFCIVQKPTCHFHHTFSIV